MGERMKTELHTRGVAVCLSLASVGLLPWLADGATGSVPLERELKSELFHFAQQPLLDGYRPGDILVVGGAIRRGKPGSLSFYGHQGVLQLPVQGVAARQDELIRGRFRVVDQGGRKSLLLVKSLAAFNSRT